MTQIPKRWESVLLESHPASDAANQANRQARLVPADESMIRQILRANFSVWSPGLSRSVYYHYQQCQLQLPWARSGLQYYAYLEGDKVVSSCKLYTFGVQSRGKTFKIAGIGAVFTQPEERGRGWALAMLNDLTSICVALDFDAMALNSDIGPDYYRKAGFECFSHMDFRAELHEGWLKAEIQKLERQAPKGLDLYVKIRKLELADIEPTLRHYRRWLTRRPFGMIRNNDYWYFKLWREFFLHKHSSSGWPELQLITVNYDKPEGGYLIFEQGAQVVRVLEVVGTQWAIPVLWAEILSLARRRKLRLLKGWEGLSPPMSGLEIVERTWSTGMLKPLKAGPEGWLSVKPCPLLELDHY